MTKTARDRAVEDFLLDEFGGKSEFYEPRSTGGRRTAGEMETLRDGLVEIAEREAPGTVRHIFYCAVSAGLVEKTEKAYKGVVVRLLTQLRRSGRLAYDAISDNTRWVLKTKTYGSPEEALEEWATTYRRDLWATTDVRVECWCEKDAIAGIVSGVANRWRVPTMVFRGYSSVSYLYSLAEEIREDGRPTYIYYVGDHDPSGVDIERYVTKTVREMVPEAQLHIERIAVTEEQIVEYGLPTRPTKETDTRSRKFKGESVEVDALDPRVLEEFVEGAILRHLDMQEVNSLLVIEKEEREGLAKLTFRPKRRGR